MTKQAGSLLTTFYRLSNINLRSTPVARSSPRKVSDLSSREQVPTFSAVLPVPVSFQSTTRPNCFCSGSSSKVDLVKGYDILPKDREMDVDSVLVELGLDHKRPCCEAGDVVRRASWGSGA